MSKKTKEKVVKRKWKNNKSTNLESNEVKNTHLFDFDKEITFEIPREVPKKVQSKITENKQKSSVKKKKQTKKIENQRVKKVKKIKKNREETVRKRKSTLKIIKWATLSIILLGALIYILLSPIFNIKDVKVSGNNQISQQEIISLSEIELNENTFKLNKKKMINNIKTKGYIENVNIKRILPDKIEIIIKEREPKFMLAYANSFAYINGQGYILEITSQKKDLPLITGFTTEIEDIHEAKRLSNNDLVKLGDLIQIIESADANEIGNLITKIDISNKEDYVFVLEKEKKTVHMGDLTNLSTKMSYIKKIINDEKGKEGEIFVNTDLKNKGAIFREKV